MTDDDRLASAILDALDSERELYPADLIELMLARYADLPLDRTAVVLDRLFADRRVARLWHRYLLPRDVETVRATWLANIKHYGSRLSANLDDHASTGDAWQMVRDWDGWQLGNGGAVDA